MSRFLVLSLMLLLAPAGDLFAADATAPEATQMAPLNTDSIGTATMKPDGTLVLNLRAEGDDQTGDAQLIYPPNHKEYATILQHVGPIKPGETKPVMPWPEND